jgi:septum formation protein
MTTTLKLGPDTRAPRVILASASRIRRTMLANAGVDVVCEPAQVDEGIVKDAMRARGEGVDAIASALAELKAAAVSARHPDALVIGADSMIACGDVHFDKPADAGRAVDQLLDLAGRTHRLLSAAVAMRAGVRVWEKLDAAHLTMRPFDRDFAQRYVATIGDAATASVGAYQLEGLGAQLFTRVEGDFFTVLGLPLLPLLDFLRGQGVIAR